MLKLEARGKTWSKGQPVKVAWERTRKRVYSGSKATSSLRGEPLFSHPCASSVNCLHTDKESKSNEGYGQSPAL